MMMESSTKITDLKPDDRPREKALSHGIKSLSDAELLTIVIGMGLPGFSAIEMSRHILHQTDNSLAAIASMPVREMMRRFKGVGEAKAVSIAAAFELGVRFRDEIDRSRDMKPVKVTSSRVVYDEMRTTLETLPHEEFWVVLLSRSNTIMAKRLISRGGTAATVVDPKLVMHEALSHLASGIILVHNHPSGNLAPSEQDKTLTKKLIKAGELLEIKVLDHLIIAHGGYTSFNDEGLMLI